MLYLMCYVLFNSGNVNDRSMCGHKDSEVALRVEDAFLTEGAVAGKPWRVGLLVRKQNNPDHKPNVY